MSAAACSSARSSSRPIGRARRVPVTALAPRPTVPSSSAPFGLPINAPSDEATGC